MGSVTANPLLQTVLIAAITKLAELQQQGHRLHIIQQLDRPMPPSFSLKGAMERKLFAMLPELFASKIDQQREGDIREGNGLR